MKRTPFVLLFVLITSLGLAASVTDNWEASCAKCHGLDGRGQTKVGIKLKVKDYSNPEVQAAMKDEDMFKATSEGVKDGAKERMKGFKDDYSAAEIKALSNLIRSFKTN